MKIGLAYDLKSTIVTRPGGPEDEAEEYDPPSTIDAIASQIEALGHRVVRLGGGAEFLDKVRSARVDFVFNIAEGRGTFRSREAQVPSVLEMLGIPYCGSDPLTLSIALDKPFAKRVALLADVKTPAFQVVEQTDDLFRLKKRLPGFPLVVKPAYEGSSKGIRLTSKVGTWDELVSAVDTSLKMYRQPVLLEEFIAGKEITVGLVGNEPQVVGIMEVVPTSASTDDFMYTLEVKQNWEKLVRYRCPPELPEQCLKEINEASVTLFKALQCRDMARIDFRVDKNNYPYFLEANPLPGLSPVYSDLPILARLSGWTYEALIDAILTAGLRRHGLGREVYAYNNSL